MAKNTGRLELKGQHIVVIDNAFIVIGECDSNGDRLLISNGAVLRRWGTSRGLGEIVAGPTAETITDPFECIVLSMSRVVFAMPSRWENIR